MRPNGQAHGAFKPDPGLEAAEQAEIEERSAPRPLVVHEVIRREGESELARSSSALAWSGLAAGLSMGFSLVAQGLLQAHLPDAFWRPLVVKLGYSVGFLIVILGRQQLFTENTLTPILVLLARPRGSVLLNVLRLWSVVLATNLLGALLFAVAVGHSDVFAPPVQQAFLEIGRESLAGDFWTVLLRGIFAGWLIALMVWLLPAAETARVSIITLLTFLVGLGGLAHIVAGSVEALYVVVVGQAAWADYLRFMLPTLLGNVLGGVALVAALNHAQVVSGDKAAE
ncbi:formate/nitrite transporter family protein [Thermithiobacillus tepidarius DSM 3134]|uniref:formate/nitrite transporter family protein n=1 Tax=Thermithiobacillus tepidarius TaxID=929 RepID=UPI0004249626|nr:formate/nitrite transporter family protein [Thermithiobacillus tepidarius]